MQLKGQVKNQVTIYGIIGVLLLGGLGTYLLTPEQLASASTCTTNNVTAIFEKLSSTNGTGYWTVNGTIKQSTCSKGEWIPTTQWLKNNNLTAKDISVQKVNESQYTENTIEIIPTDIKTNVIINQSKQLSIGGIVYNFTYTEKAPIQTIKCICEKATGCKIQECLI